MSGTQITILFVLLLFSGLFSGIETALMSLNMIKVKALLKQKKNGAEALYRIKQNPHKLIITILIGNNAVNIGAAALATVIFTNAFGSSGVGIATGVMTFLILVFGEITPKTYASQNSENISLFVARPIEILALVLSPLVIFFELISRGMTKILGSKVQKELSEEELQTIVTMGVKEGILDREAGKMIHNLLEFEGTKVTRVMTTRDSIHMINGKLKLKDVMNYVIKSHYSVYPIYMDNKNKIIGVLDVDDILKYVKQNRLNVKVKALARDVFFVPESKEIDDLLSEFEGKHVPMAIVVDEYGAVSGLVTVEDILEEIVGDIFDKSKRSGVFIKKIGGNAVRASGRATVEEINKIMHLGLKRKYFETIAGFIEDKFKKIPKKGEKLKLKNVTIEIEKVTRQRIEMVKISRR